MSSEDVARLFTIDEALALLPELRGKLQELQHGKQELAGIHQTLRGVSPAMRSNGSGVLVQELEARAAELVGSMGALLADVEGTGVVVKDLDMGLIDFPSLREGRVVYLCWMVSENTIEFWHEIEDGFGGRQAL